MEICVHTCVHIYIYIEREIYTYMSLYVCVCMYMYVCMYVCIYIYILMYISGGPRAGRGAEARADEGGPGAPPQDLIIICYIMFVR